MSAHQFWLGPIATTSSVKHQAAGAMGWAMASQFARLLSILVSTMILARLLQPSDFGLLAMAVTLTGLMMLFKDAGLGTATAQSAELNQTQVSTLWWLNLGVGVMLTAVTLACAWPLAWFFNELRVIPLVYGMATMVLLGAIGVQHEALLRRKLKFKSLAVIESASSVLAAVAAVVMAYYGAGWWALVAQKVLTVGFGTLGYWLACNWRPGWRYSWATCRADVLFGAHLSGFSLVNYFSRNADNILIGWYWGAALLGIYAKAYDTLLAPLQQIGFPLQKALLPILARVKDDPVRIRKVLVQSYIPAMVAMIPIGGVMAFLPESAVGFLFGPGWEAAIPVVVWLSGAVMTQLQGHAIGTLLISQGQGRVFMLVGGLQGAVISVSAFIIGLPFGIEYVALAYVLAHILLHQPLMAWFATRSGPVRFADIMGLLVLPFVCFAWVAVGLTVFKAFTGTWPQVVQLLAGSVLAGILTLVGLVSVQEGRQLLRQLYQLLIEKMRKVA